MIDEMICGLDSPGSVSEVLIYILLSNSRTARGARKGTTMEVTPRGSYVPPCGPRWLLRNPFRSRTSAALLSHANASSMPMPSRSIDTESHPCPISRLRGNGEVSLVRLSRLSHLETDSGRERVDSSTHELNSLQRAFSSPDSSPAQTQTPSAAHPNRRDFVPQSVSRSATRSSSMRTALMRPDSPSP